MKLVHVSEAPVAVSVKKLPMDKDPVFLAQLRKEIITDHNNKIRSKKAINQ